MFESISPDDMTLDRNLTLGAAVAIVSVICAFEGMLSRMISHIELADTSVIRLIIAANTIGLFHGGNSTVSDVQEKP